MGLLLKVTKTILINAKKSRNFHTTIMANSRYEYVKNFELDDKIIPNCWIVVRIDGKGFHKFSNIHAFEKPNDLRALNLMNRAALDVMEQFREITLAYGQSDEYSFIFRKDAEIYNRRSAKILSYATSQFTSSYVLNWNAYFPDKKLEYPPAFDGRIVLYPSDENLKDYLSWRQADVHINNLYNTAFWNLVIKSGLSNQEAEERLRGTFAADKNELLFTEFGINYNNLPKIFRKGTILLRKNVKTEKFNRQLIISVYEDMIRDKFWKDHSELLGKYVPGSYNYEDSKNNDSSIDILEKQIEKLQME